MGNQIINTSENHNIQNGSRCYSKNTRYQCELTWTIQHFQLYINEKKRNTIRSSRFSAAEDACKLYLELQTPFNRINMSNTKLFLKICNNTANFEKLGPITGQVQCSIINSNGQKENMHTANFLFDSNQLDYCFENFIKYKNMYTNREFFPGDRLTIHCSVSYLRKNNITLVIKPLSQSSVLNAHKPSPMKDFGKLFNNEELSDVAIYVGDKKYPGHQLILAARSSVFKTMFTHDMEEKKLNRIDIEDIDEKIFLEALRYIYTGKVVNIKTMAFELLIAADKYDLKGLKMMCENELCKMLTVDTAVKILSYSDAYKLHKLRNHTIQYIKMNMAKITDSETWDDLISQPDLMKAVLRA